MNSIEISNQSQNVSTECQCSQNHSIMKLIKENESVTEEELDKFANIPIESLTGYNKALFENLGQVLYHLENLLTTSGLKI